MIKKNAVKQTAMIYLLIIKEKEVSNMVNDSSIQLKPKEKGST